MALQKLTMTMNSFPFCVCLLFFIRVIRPVSDVWENLFVRIENSLLGF